MAAVGFTWLNVITFLSNAGYAPLLVFNRNIYDMKKPEDAERDEAERQATAALMDGSAAPGGATVASGETRHLNPTGEQGGYYGGTDVSATNYNAYDYQQQQQQQEQQQPQQSGYDAQW